MLFLAAILLLGVAGGTFDPTFNNYLRDTFPTMTAQARGGLEFPRELPGFLTALMSGALFFLVEARMAALAALAFGAGMLGLAAYGSHWNAMVGCILILNAGSHLMMPVQGAIGLSLAEQGKEASLLGRIGGVGTAGSIVGASLIWFSSGHLKLSYPHIFTIGAVFAVGAALVLMTMHAHVRPRRRKPFLYKPRYRLFYLLSILFGARKQVFITFAPWVLIQVFHQDPSTFAKLLIASSLIGIPFKPLLGQWIDRFGERRILVLDAILMIGVCLGYGFAQKLGLGKHAITLVFGCYMLDQLLFSVGMARTTYLDKIAESRDDVAPTLSLGVSIDHAVSMTVPTLGGLLWLKAGYPYVFFAAGCIAVLTAVAASRVRVPD